MGRLIARRHDVSSSFFSLSSLPLLSPRALRLADQKVVVPLALLFPPARLHRLIAADHCSGESRTPSASSFLFFSLSLLVLGDVTSLVQTACFPILRRE